LLLKEKAANALKTTFTSLKYKNFRYFWIGQCISLMGTWMQRTAQVWLVYTITKSPLLVGLLGVCQFMPMLLFTLFAGVFVDRFPKRTILILTQTAFMTLGFTMTLLVYLGIVQYWEILVITTLFGLSQTVDMPARQSFFIELVGKKDIMNGISLNSTIFNLAKIVGPALSGIVMVKFGVLFCFLIDAISYIAVIIGLCMIKTENTVPQRIRRHVVQEITEGLRYIKQNETLVLNSLIMAVVCTFAFNNDVIVPVFAKTVLNQGADVYTGLMSAAGIGSFIAAVAMAAVAKNGIKKNLFIFDAVATTLLQILMIFARNYYLALVMVAILGFVNMSFLNLCNSIFQVNTTSEYRGRVMSVYSFLNQGSTPVGNFYSGSVMDRFGGIAGFPACGAAALILLVPIFALKRKMIVHWLKN
jgi:Arabinose efflux permease